MVIEVEGQTALDMAAMREYCYYYYNYYCDYY